MAVLQCTAVAEATGMSTSAQAAGLAADNLICAGVAMHVPWTWWSKLVSEKMSYKYVAMLHSPCDTYIAAAYFTTIFYLARKIPADAQPVVDKAGSAVATGSPGSIQVTCEPDDCTEF
jgi:hypothetical protein